MASTTAPATTQRHGGDEEQRPHDVPAGQAPFERGRRSRARWPARRRRRRRAATPGSGSPDRRLAPPPPPEERGGGGRRDGDDPRRRQLERSAARRRQRAPTRTATAAAVPHQPTAPPRPPRPAAAAATGRVRPARRRRAARAQRSAVVSPASGPGRGPPRSRGTGWRSAVTVAAAADDQRSTPPSDAGARPGSSSAVAGDGVCQADDEPGDEPPVLALGLRAAVGDPQRHARRRRWRPRARGRRGARQERRHVRRRRPGRRRRLVELAALIGSSRRHPLPAMHDGTAGGVPGGWYSCPFVARDRPGTRSGPRRDRGPMRPGRPAPARSSLRPRIRRSAHVQPLHRITIAGPHGGDRRRPGPRPRRRRRRRRRWPRRRPRPRRQPRLVGRAVLPAGTFADGPPAGPDFVPPGRRPS